MPDLLRVATPSLDIACEASGPPGGAPVILLHGFPYDPRAYDGMVPPLVAAGHRVLVPYLRGYGTTRFNDPRTLRSGQQAALGCDLRALMDALAIPAATLAGYDWGGRAACIAAALWPERVTGLVTIGGYNIQNIPAAGIPKDPETEYRHWYQYYFNTPRGQAGLTADRGALCRKLWELWSPNWRFDDATFARSAASFDNPDFVDVVIHSYRHRYGYVAGDPALEEVETRLAAQPPITVPTIAMQGNGDGVEAPGGSRGHARHFTGRYQHREVPVVGHNMPQEAPMAVVEAVLEVVK